MTPPARVHQPSPGRLFVAFGGAVAALFWLYHLTAFLSPVERPWHMIVVQSVAGLAAIVALTLWRRSAAWCLLIVAGCLFLSPAGVGAAFAVQAASAWRRGRSLVVLVTGVGLVATKIAQLLLGPYHRGWIVASTVELTVAVAGLAAATLTGWLLRSVSAERTLREDARLARRDAEHARMEQVRLQERERISREMHDVLAHRISLVAMHAGALVYRDDLDPKTTRETARVIHGNAKQALDELRGILSGLRDGTHDHDHPEPPQPTLRELPVLVAEARSTDTPVRLALTATGLDDLPTQVSRSAYRILQEGLTNARKHAPQAPVELRVDDGPDNSIVLTVGNPLSREQDHWPAGAGLGLVGVTERAQLLGGTVTVGPVDGRFELTVTFPRPSA
ncbi:signal transduction histidine kinase [Hamadaea flava]|uniref:histidine kinase n=1 Tax=Hamadaea flava TaxID=1742688 RepID=A0ABV8LQM0_9ACTN|nr:histidine kinase [Hamadaea flava]MCP2323312.1 signal transduction histidine kinase [Hamadaea flava]